MGGRIKRAVGSVLSGVFFLFILAALSPAMLLLTLMDDYDPADSYEFRNW